MTSFSDIIDNRTLNLKDEINDKLSGSEKIKFAVGYLYLSGFYQIADKLEPLKEAKLIIGSNLNKELVEALAESLPGDEEIDRAYKNNSLQRPTDKTKIKDKIASSIISNVQALPHTILRQKEISKLAQLVKNNKIIIKVYTKYPLHAKAYIFKYKDDIAKAAASEGIGIVGSSNLTMSGFYHNTELNTYVRGQKNFEELNIWFDKLWEEAVEFDSTLGKLLEESWALKTVNPYDIFILTLYHLTKVTLEKQTSQIWFWENPDYMARLTARFKNMDDLFPFQKVAIMQAYDWLNKYNGVFVSDVVGLGKTYIGAGLLKQLNRRILIISPPGLVQMWEEFIEKFEIDGKVLSRGVLTNGIYDKSSQLWQYREREIVLIDESHHFRNDDTMMYREVQPFLASKKVILMTATPQNTSVWNIYNQIKLFHQSEENIFPNRFEEPHLRNLFKKVERDEYRLPDLLKHIVIRRTRKHIKQFYTDGDFNISFPIRDLETVTYSINQTYNQLYDEIRQSLKRLKYARYNLWEYVIPNKKEVEPYNQLKKVVGTLKVFHKINLFKRLESSIYAFRKSIGNLLDIHRKFLTIIEEKQIVPAGEEIQEMIYRKELSDFWDKIEEMTGDYKISDFDIDKLTESLKHDISILEAIQNDLNKIPQNVDSKFDRLLSAIEELKKSKKQDKILIFSEYADTVDYLGLRLGKIYKLADKVHGGTKNNSIKIKAFSPKSNDYEGKEIINLMVASDVLSEGHNLQDCSALINYDLHWNPVRLIQRAGRVDRIGSEASTIYIKNFLPVAEVEKEINLQHTLADRIREIHEHIGEDERILTEDEQLNEDAMYAIYQTRDMEKLEQAESQDFTSEEAEMIVQNLNKSNPEYMALIKKMQLGLRSAKKIQKYSGSYAFFRAGELSKLFIRKADGQILDDFVEVLNEIRCPSNEKELQITDEVIEKYYDDIIFLKERFESSASDEELSMKIEPEVRKTQKRLQEISRSKFDNTDFVDNASKIDKALNSYFPIHLIGELKLLNREKNNDIFYEGLVNLYNKERLSDLYTESSEEKQKPTIEFICGEIIQ